MQESVCCGQLFFWLIAAGHCTGEGVEKKNKGSFGCIYTDRLVLDIALHCERLLSTGLGWYIHDWEMGDERWKEKKVKRRRTKRVDSVGMFVQRKVN